MEHLRLRGEALEWRETEGEILIFDGASESYLTLNQSGAELWQQLAGGASAAQLEEFLEHRYGLDTARARSDVAAFLGWLDERGMLAPEA